MMKKEIRVFIVGLCIAILLFAFRQDRPLTIYIIGDSTAAIKQERAFPETGWGMAFAKLADQHVKVDNRALNGRSSKSFKHDVGKDGSIMDHWTPIVEHLQHGDYVFIQFGHNDEKINKPNVGTSLEEFEQNLTFYIQQTREKGAIPVLLTSIARRKFEGGSLVPTHGDYPSIMKKLAENLHVHCIDMEEKTSRLLSSYGDEKSKPLFLHVEKGNPNYPEGKQDDTHLSPIGASAVANLVVEGIKELKLPISKHFEAH
ncbi:rhamnogalacturonan acetylesterase [Sphingobacterium thalpophilum]|uniref:Rhamnogalacturonan acetylesterase rhgT n=1 Tax=Sphingobacterium thalpophilum TaxID=259 RepID=A0A4U9UWW0_9SPHI|nr:rhamnogalacturonan acetylesterase [Sphingobacterium thalpophilum]VTR36792.1 Rhamnogalacturonan acetylesterase rhgT [Sphingobacterium thalpophilum]